MALINDESKEIYIRLVYCGPESSGKRSNLNFIHRKVNPKQRGDLTALHINGITFFDFTPANIGDIKGYKPVFHICSLPGKTFGSKIGTRLLEGVDGIVFVAASDPALTDEGAETLNRLESAVKGYGADFSGIPLVFQYNRRDVGGASGVEALEASLNRFNAPYVEAVASDGKGVLETFTNISKLLLKSLREKEDLSAAKSAGGDELLATIARIRSGEENAGEDEAVEITGDAKEALSGEEMEEAALGESIDKYSYDEDLQTGAEDTEGVQESPAEEQPEYNGRQHPAFEEEGGEEPAIEGDELPEGIEMEPGFEVGEDEEELTLEGEELPEMEELGETAMDISDEAPLEPSHEDTGAGRGIDIPEGIEMEPGFEVGEDEEALALEGDELPEMEELGETAMDISDEAPLEPSHEDAGVGGGIDMPEGIEMEPGFEVDEDEEELTLEGDELLEMEELGETAMDISDEAPLETPYEEIGAGGGIDIPEGIEMEPGFEVGEDEEDLALEGDELPEMEELGEVAMDISDEASLETPYEEIGAGGGIDIPEGIEMEPGLEVGEDEEELVLEGDELPEIDDLGEAAIDMPGESHRAEAEIPEDWESEMAELQQAAARSEEPVNVFVGQAESGAGGSVSIPVFVDTEKGRKSFRINLSIGIEEEGSPVILAGTGGRDEREAARPPIEIEPSDDTSFLNEFDEERPQAPVVPHEVTEKDEAETKSEKKGLLSRLFGGGKKK